MRCDNVGLGGVEGIQFSYFGNHEARSPSPSEVKAMTSFACGPLKVPGAVTTFCLGRDSSNRIFFGGPDWGFHTGDNPYGKDRTSGGQLCQAKPAGVCIDQSTDGTNTGELWALGCNATGPKLADTTLGCLFPNKQLNVAVGMKAFCKNLHECALLSFLNGHQVMRSNSDGGYEVLDSQGPWPGSTLCGPPKVEFDPSTQGSSGKDHGEVLKVYPASETGLQTMVLLRSKGTYLNGNTFIDAYVTQQVGTNGCADVHTVNQRIEWHPGFDKEIADQRCGADKPTVKTGDIELTCGVAMSVTTSAEASDAMSSAWATSVQGLASLSLFKATGLYSAGSLSGLLGQVAAALILGLLLPDQMMASTVVVGPWEQ